MADSTIVVDIVDKSVPELCQKKIAIINQPNPAIGVTVTGRQLLHLIQLPQYWITESATGNAINGRNIFQYFPELDPDVGGKTYTMISKAVDTNGIYVASSEGVDGYRTMVVQVSPNVESKTITANGTYNASMDNVDGYSDVTINVPQESVIINFYDYDGSIVYSYTGSEFANLTTMPENPSHEGLIAQGWNWSLSDAKKYVSKYGSMSIGQVYTADTDSRTDTILHIRLEEGRLKPYLGLRGDSSGTAVSIDWGDDSAVESVILDTNTVYTPHEYATSGEYTISISVTTGSITLTGSSSYYSNILRKSSSSNGNADKVYQSALISIDIGSNVSIEDYAFYNCKSLVSVTIPDTVTSIGQQAFRNCSTLAKINIPNGVTTIKTYTFYGCVSLHFITIPDTVTTIGDYAFYYCYSLTSIIIPNGVASIGSNAFSGCTSSTSITIPDTVTTIEQQAFPGCSAITSITIPDTVTSIGNNAFSSCSAITSITIPDSVTTIGSQAIATCNALTSITIPDSVTSIGNNAFTQCYSLASVIILGNVTIIGAGMCNYCKDLQSVTLPDSVTSIGNYAFGSCDALTSINIPDGVTSIGQYAFYNCSSLTTINIPDGVTSIEKQTFYSCYALTSITIPDTVTSIGQQAFQYCCGLGFIKFEGSTPPTVASSNAWSDIPTDCKIYVPSSALNTYKRATNYPSSSTYTYVGY